MSRKGDGVGSGLEVAQRAIDVWNREDLNAFLQTWHPDCEWRPAFPSSVEPVPRADRHLLAKVDDRAPAARETG
jgi:ketosteroid isomerase-like protein